ncbi:hypothetical protein TWF696_008692 [Orbilia brochopaga]|uniref:Uncharacterized protein n=1 Tax=Orbilia brochopaga TaxID=3140254 RepID=A0AAV9UIM9_9PEZI
MPKMPKMPKKPRQYDFQVYCAFKRFFRGWGGTSENRNGIRKVISRNREDPVIARIVAEKGNGTVVRALQDLIDAKAFNKATKFEALFPSIARPEPPKDETNGGNAPGSTTNASGPQTVLPSTSTHQTASTPGTASVNSSAAVNSNPESSAIPRPDSNGATHEPSNVIMPARSDAVPERSVPCDLDLSIWRPTGPTSGPLSRPAAEPSARPVASVTTPVTKPTAYSAGPTTRPTVRPDARPSTKPTTTKAVNASRPARNTESCLKPGATKGSGLTPGKITKPASGKPDRSSNRVQDRLAAIQGRRLAGAWGGPLLTAEPAPMATGAGQQKLPVEQETSHKLVNHAPWYPEGSQAAGPQVQVGAPVPAPAPAVVVSAPIEPVAEGGQVPSSHEADLTIKSYFPLPQQMQILEEAQSILKNIAFRVVGSEKPAVLANAGVTGPSQLTLSDAAVALRLSNGESALSPSFQSFTRLEQAIHEGRRMEPGTLAQLICSCAREIGGLRDSEGPESFRALKGFTIEAVLRYMDSHAERLKREVQQLDGMRAEVLSW